VILYRFEHYCSRVRIRAVTVPIFHTRTSISIILPDRLEMLLRHSHIRNRDTFPFFRESFRDIKIYERLHDALHTCKIQKELITSIVTITIYNHSLVMRYDTDSIVFFCGRFFRFRRNNTFEGIIEREIRLILQTESFILLINTKCLFQQNPFDHANRIN